MLMVFSVAWAEDSVRKGKELVLPDFKEAQKALKESERVKYKAECTTENGQVMTASHPNYNQCMARSLGHGDRVLIKKKTGETR